MLKQINNFHHNTKGFLLFVPACIEHTHTHSVIWRASNGAFHEEQILSLPFPLIIRHNHSVGSFIHFTIISRLAS